ncbi:MAG TPA: bifunctional (p)ppGpp synthetase/guanosine-3',5'-bis(diphosphate) 3'-pyrophosphohydrolase, partial [Campylobacterales bacterium]|nr:bifunctional (p)ppGpp synthetase/guanosine-3',5'-bis(diphosphate) 3'-pyrophosphohydrolase [Campylobacterales bacterium]
VDALNFAIESHKNQFRKSGEPYVVHPILVAAIVGYISQDKTMVITALLHDVIEDTPITIEEIKDRFGKDVANLVEGVTKIVEIRDESLIPSNSDEKLITSALSFRKILLASIKDVRVLVIKLCDRLHNMLTLDALEPKKQKRIAEETLVVYAPIAHRLGISFIKNILEDLSFYYIFPKDYQYIDNFFKSHKQELQIKLNSFIDDVKKIMVKNGFRYNEFSIISRIKHYYSIYLKMHRKGISIEEVLDLLAIRVLVKNKIDCYKALGVIHLNFKPLIMRFKDYVAIPKENGYQTIHTTVFDNRSIFEVQIRTFDMHKTAEYGIAAHWKYKLGVDTINLKWLENLQYQNNNIEEFYELVKNDLFSEDISVFSPKGDLFTLPRGAVALDFAYAIHTDIGQRAKEVYINKSKSTLLTELNNGDIIRVITAEEPILRCSWIDAVKTSKAKEHMRHMCKQKIKEINSKSAINILASEFKVSKNEIIKWLEENSLLQNIHKITTDINFFNEIKNRFLSYLRKKKKIFPFLNIKRIKKQLLDNFMIYSSFNINSIEFDYCCNPKMGDEIIAFKNKNVAILHHKLCKKANSLIEKDEPMLLIFWAKRSLPRYKLLVSLQNKKGALASLLQYLLKLDINLISVELGRNIESGNVCELEIETKIDDIEVLKKRLEAKAKVIEITGSDDAYKK